MKQDCEGALRAFMAWENLPYDFSGLEETVVLEARDSGDPLKALILHLDCDPTLVEIIWDAFYEGWKQNHKVALNRSQRRIFACTKKWFKVARKGEHRGHEEWLNTPDIWDIVRGYIGPDMKTVSFYKGIDHIIDDDVRFFVRPALSYLMTCKLLTLDTEVHLGAVPGDYSTLWKSREVLGTVKNVMSIPPTDREVECINAWL